MLCALAAAVSWKSEPETSAVAWTPLKAAGKTLNTKTFDQKINNGNYTFKSSAAGGQGQMEFPSMHFIPADCASMLKIDGTTYKQVVPFKCYPSLVKK